MTTAEKAALDEQREIYCKHILKQQSYNTTDKTKAWDKIRLLKVRFEFKVIMKGNKQNLKMFGEYIICWLYFSKMKIIRKITKRKPVYSHE